MPQLRQYLQKCWFLLPNTKAQVCTDLETILDVIPVPWAYIRLNYIIKLQYTENCQSTSRFIIDSVDQTIDRYYRTC
jgi:hypothetical protein